MYYIPPNTNVEVNLGCPNVHEYGIPPSIMKDYCTKFNVIAKLSPDENIKETAAMCIEAGVQKLQFPIRCLIQMEKAESAEDVYLE